MFHDEPKVRIFSFSVPVELHESEHLWPEKPSSSILLSTATWKSASVSVPVVPPDLREGL